MLVNGSSNFRLKFLNQRQPGAVHIFFEDTETLILNQIPFNQIENNVFTFINDTWFETPQLNWVSCNTGDEYIWNYNTNVGHSPKRFTTAHRTILHVRKTKNNKFYKDNVALPYKNPTDRRILNNLKNGSKGRMPYSWFYFDLVKNVSKEKTKHACQIPQKLTEMLIKSCTMPNDIVLVLFGGSGSELEVCKLLDRQYVSAEIDPKYHEIITDRLKNGYIKKKYKLQFKKNKEIKSIPNLSLFTESGQPC